MTAKKSTKTGKNSRGGAGIFCPARIYTPGRRSVIKMVSQQKNANWKIPFKANVSYLENPSSLDSFVSFVSLKLDSIQDGFELARGLNRNWARDYIRKATFQSLASTKTKKCAGQ